MNLKHSYSLDEEHFDGDFDSDVAAAEAAFSKNPAINSVFTGVNTPYAAQDFINGRLLMEIIGEEAYDECGEPAFDWLHNLQEDILKLAEFEKLIGDWLEQNAPVVFFTVDEIQEFTRPE
jgi:hypothetical protein